MANKQQQLLQIFSFKATVWLKEMMWLMVTLLICTTTFHADAKRDYVIEIMEYRFNNISPISVKTYNYKLLRHKFITFEFMLNRFVSEMELKYKFDIVKKDNKRINLLNINIDGCKCLESAYSLPLIATTTKEIRRRGNLPKSCPLQPNKLYYIRNYTVNEDDYPKFAPTMAFQTFTDFYFDKQYQGSLVLGGRVRKH